MAGLAGCGGDGGDDTPDQLTVAAAFFPLQEAAERIGGDRVNVTNLTPVGGQPHGLVPSAAATQALASAEVVLYVGGPFQPAVAAAAARLPAEVAKIDVLGDEPLEPVGAMIPGVRGEVDGVGTSARAAPRQEDPHGWVDPDRFAAIAGQVQSALIAADPGGRAGYEQRGRAYIDELRGLATEYEQRLTQCASKVIVTSHPAFGYLARRYELSQAIMAGITPESTPDPRSLAATARFAKANGVDTIFFTAPVPSRLNRAVKTATGAETATLDPVEGLTQDGVDSGRTYASIMRDNLAVLEGGLRCGATG